MGLAEHGTGGVSVRCPACRTRVMDFVGCGAPGRLEEMEVCVLIVWWVGADQGISELMKANGEWGRRVRL